MCHVGDVEQPTLCTHLLIGGIEKNFVYGVAPDGIPKYVCLACCVEHAVCQLHLGQGFGTVADEINVFCCDHGNNGEGGCGACYASLASSLVVQANVALLNGQKTLSNQLRRICTRWNQQFGDYHSKRVTAVRKEKECLKST